MKIKLIFIKIKKTLILENNEVVIKALSQNGIPNKLHSLITEHTR